MRRERVKEMKKKKKKRNKSDNIWGLISRVNG